MTPEETVTFQLSDQLVTEQQRIGRFLLVALPVLMLLFMWMAYTFIPPFISLSLTAMIVALIIMPGFMLLLAFVMKWVTTYQLTKLRRVKIILGSEGIERRREQMVEFFPYATVRKMVVARDRNGTVHHLNLQTGNTGLTFYRLNNMDRLAALLEARLPRHTERKNKTTYFNREHPGYWLLAFVVLFFFSFLFLKVFQGSTGFMLLPWIFIFFNGLYMILYRPLSRVWGDSYRWRENFLAGCSLVAIVAVLFFGSRWVAGYDLAHPCHPINRFLAQSSCVATFDTRRHLAFMPDQSTLVLSSYDTIWLQPVPDRLFYIPQVLRFDELLAGFDISANGEQLVSWSRTSREGTVWFWDLSANDLQHRQQVSPVDEVVLSPAGDILAVSGLWRDTELWSTESWQPTATFTETRAIAFSPDGFLLATTSPQQDTAVQLWQIDGLVPVRSLVLAEDRAPFIRHIVFSPDGNWLAASTSQDFIYAWQLAGGTKQFSWSFSTDFLSKALAFSPVDDILAAGIITYENQAHIQLWSLEDGALLATIPVGNRSSDRPQSLAFSADGTLLAVATYNRAMVFRLDRILPP